MSLKRALIFLLAFCTVAAVGQSRRVRTTTGDRPNARTPAPSPTPPRSDRSDADDSGEVVTVDTRLVTIPVRVLDRNNRFIGGLVQSDFKIFEENSEQEIAYFTNEAQPFTVALVLDMSYSTTFKITEIQAAAIAFIDQLRPDDKVMVISFDEEVHMLCEATTDRKRIYRAINSTRIQTGTSLYEAVDLTMNSRLRSIKGRKAMVLFTDGVDTTSLSSNDLENLGDAREIDTLIYPVRYDTFNDVQSIRSRPQINLPGTTPPGGTATPFPTIALPSTKGTSAEEYARAQEYLTKLADLSGGRLHEASNYGNLNRAFSKIASELREFYSLGYYPADDGRPGSTRRIKVRVSKQGVAVRARDSYVVPKEPKVRTH